jgi:hypothetical protein
VSGVLSAWAVVRVSAVEKWVILALLASTVAVQETLTGFLTRPAHLPHPSLSQHSPRLCERNGILDNLAKDVRE